MSITSELTVLVYDYGGYSYIAERFARSCKRVLYYCPFEEGFPKYNKFVIGSGMEGVEKVQSFWPYFDDIDLWIFPDLYQGEFQDWLRNQGKAVFGAGGGEKMETHRDMMKSLQRSLGMELNQYEVIHGLNDLQKYLEKNEDKYVKTNVLRGGMETWHHENIKLSQPYLDGLNHSLGVFKERQVFIVESPIENAVEYGFDGFVMEGQYTSKTMFGIEKKNCGYLAVFVDYDKLPGPLKDINKKLSATFEQYGYRGWYSNEVRSFAKDKGILLDQTCRCGEPPTAIATELFLDYPLYAWQTAIGQVPNAKAKYKYGAQVVIKSDWARKDPQAIYFPDQYKDYIKLTNHVVQDGIHYCVPIPSCEFEEIGFAIGMGNTIKEAINQVQVVAKSIQGYGISVECDSLGDIQKEIDKLSGIGVKIF